MTPNNIVNMAFIKGLDIIAVTDHNACHHSRAIDALASKLGILAIPGMEVQTKEEVHMLCYFPTVDLLEAFDASLMPKKAKIKNNIKIFGNQSILDENDALIGEVEDALIMSINISIEELVALVETFKGALVPAHVNKSSNSILAN
ncbi:MAG TPA: phosphoesterase, partial [Clostridiales bacterium UBA8960]|nr:phosphoesterase [Clostridiales bacterium UBA8960]